MYSAMAEVADGAADWTKIDWNYLAVIESKAGRGGKGGEECEY
jgi:hypothetical protein